MENPQKNNLPIFELWKRVKGCCFQTTQTYKNPSSSHWLFTSRNYKGKSLTAIKWGGEGELYKMNEEVISLQKLMLKLHGNDIQRRNSSLAEAP